MPQTRPFLFYVTKLVHKKTLVQQIRTDAKLQTELSTLFKTQQESFLATDGSPLPFYPGETCDSNQLFEIPDFSLPDVIAQTIESQDAIESLHTDNFDNIRSIFAVDSDGSLLFQRFTSRQRLVGKFHLVLSKNTFRKEENAGLLVGEKLVAVVQKNTLLFQSFAAAKAVLPTLTDSVAEASDSQVRSFTEHPLLYVQNSAQLLDNTTSWHRRRISAIVHDSCLEGVTAKELQNCANLYGLKIDLMKNPSTQKLQIVMPVQGKKLRMTLKFLNNELLYSEFADKRFAVPSKRQIARNK